MSRFSEQIGLSPSSTWAHPFKGWMRFTLFAAGIYNIIWGAVVVLFPMLMFDLLGMETPNYPEFWQCVGMIVGVYGVGYLAAARNPFTHWPITLVGLLGKVLGPIGFAKALIEERFPIAFGLNIITNDLIWWIPFFFILKGAYDYWMNKDAELTTIYKGEGATTFNHLLSQKGQSIHSLSRDKPIALVLLRHSGCTFCRKMLTDIGNQRRIIEEKGLELVFVHMGEEDPATHAFFQQYDLEDCQRFSDKERVLYKTLGIERGGFRDLFGAQSIIKGIPAFMAGHGVGAVDGDGFQLSGVAVIYQGAVKAVDVHQNASATTNILQLYQQT